MNGALTALFVVVPAIACAADGGGEQFSFLSSFLQMMAALAIVVGLILLTWYFSGRLMKGLPGGQSFSAKHIRIVESRYIGPKKALLLVEVSGEYLLLASCDNQLSLVKQIDMLEDIEIIEEAATPNSFSALLSRLRQT